MGFPDVCRPFSNQSPQLVAGDASVIFEIYSQDADVSRYLTWRPSTSVDETRRFVQMCLVAENSRTYVIVLRATGAVLGGFDLRKPGRAKLEFGYVLARPFWGMGLMTKAICAAVDWALRQPGIWRIGRVADIDNIGSVRVMEKAGLYRESVLRRWHVHPNAGDTPVIVSVFPGRAYGTSLGTRGEPPALPVKSFGAAQRLRASAASRNVSIASQ